MKFRILPAIVVAVAFTVAAGAQDAGSAPPPGQNSVKTPARDPVAATASAAAAGGMGGAV